MNSALTSHELLDEYLHHVNDLYDHVRRWIAGYDSDAEIFEETISLKEEPVDPYEARVLVIKRPEHKVVRMVPRGRWIIGAEGRVDLKSSLGTETLVYVSDGGPAISINMLTESGKVLEDEEGYTTSRDVARGWVFVQNRQLGMLPALDADLFYRLLEVLGR